MKNCILNLRYKNKEGKVEDIPSTLYASIYKATDSKNKSDAIYKMLTTSYFKERLGGDWTKNLPNAIEGKELEVSKNIDDTTFEPILHKDEGKDNYYVIDKYGEKLYVLNNPQPLLDFFSSSEVRTITKDISKTYLEDNNLIGSDDINDITLTDIKGNLNSHIESYLRSMQESFNNSDDFMVSHLGDSYGNSVQFINEWSEIVKDYFKELSLVYTEESIAGDMQYKEEATRTSEPFGMASFERSTKDAVSANIKLRLSLLRNTDENSFDPVLNKMPFKDYDEVYSDLIRDLTDIMPIQGEDMYNLYIDRLREMSIKKPYINQLVELLERSDINTKRQFVQAFNLHKNNFIASIVEYNKNDDGTVTPEYKVLNISSEADKYKKVFGDWNYNFLSKHSDNKGNISLDKESIKKFNNDLKNLRFKFEKSSFEDISNELTSLLDEYLGIEISERGLSHYAEDFDFKNKSPEEMKKPLAKVLSSLVYLGRDLESGNINLKDNIEPLASQSILRDLARGEAYYISDGSDSSVWSAGKTKWIFSYPSYLSNKINGWREDPLSITKHIDSTPFNTNSRLGKYFTGSDLRGNEGTLQEKDITTLRNRINEFELGIFNSLQEEGRGVDSVSNKEIEKIDFYADSVNKSLGIKKTGGKSYMTTPTPADKGTQYLFAVPKELFINSNARYSENGDVKVNDNVTDILYNYFIDEYNRILKVKEDLNTLQDSEKIKYYHTSPYGDAAPNGLKFNLLESLNKYSINKELGFNLVNKDGTINTDLTFLTSEKLSQSRDSLSPESIEYKLREYINKIVSDNIKDTIDYFNNNKLVTNKNGVYKNNSIDKDIWSNYDGNVVKMAADFYVNNLSMQVEFSKMFIGDYAYFKNMSDYKKRIPGTYTDGRNLVLGEGETYFNVASISDVEIASPNHKELVELLGKDLANKYLGVDTTDAQGWITPERWKFLQERLGKWTPTHDSLYEKMVDPSKRHEYTTDELNIMATPLKGVYYGVLKGVPTYLKYSQAVLAPGLINGQEGLKRLYDKMTLDEDGNTLEYSDQIHEVVTNSGIKVGGPLPEIIHNNDYSIKEDFSLNTMQLSNYDWKLQQDLPTKGYGKLDVPSQLQKNIFAGLNNNLDHVFSYRGEKVSGRDLFNKINSIVSGLSDKGMNSLRRELGIGSDYTISNEDAFIKALTDQLKERGVERDVIDHIERGMSVYGIPGLRNKINNTFASMVHKRTVKIQTSGGAYIQMSNFGMNKTSAKEAGTRFVPWMDSNINTTPKYAKDGNGNIKTNTYIDNGKEITKKVIEPGQILISGSFLTKFIPNWKEMTDDRLFGTKENNYEDGLIDRKILENVIGARIPNQGLSSNDALSIVGILPEAQGDTVIAYADITTKTGSDFDIDKMFIMMPKFTPKFKNIDSVRHQLRTKLKGEFLRDSATNVLNTLLTYIDDSFLNGLTPEEYISSIQHDKRINVINNGLDILAEYVIELDHPTINELIGNLDVDLGGIRYNNNDLGNQLIESYKSILIDENVIDQTMDPIDRDYIKDDILSITEVDSTIDTFDFNINKQIDLKFNFKDGQTGVGIAANHLTDHTRGLVKGDTTVKYVKNYIFNRSIYSSRYELDPTFSKDLSKKELDYYYKKYGKDLELSKQDIKSYRVADSISSILNGFVDIANDNFITRGNWNNITSSTGLTMLRLGIHPYKVNAFLNTTILKEFAEYSKNSNSILSGESGNVLNNFRDFLVKREIADRFDNIPEGYLNAINTGIIKNSILPLNSLIKSLKYANIQSNNVSNELLNYTIKTILDFYNKGSKYNSKLHASLLSNIDLQNINRQSDAYLLDKFEIFQKMANSLREGNEALKNDVNGYGKDAMELTTSYNKVINAINSETLGNFESKLLDFDGNFSQQHTYIKNSIMDIAKIMEANPKYFLELNPELQYTFNTISNLVYGENLMNQNLADKLGSFFYSYLMSEFPLFNLEASERTSLLNDIPKRVSEFKNSGIDNFFINELEFKRGDKNRTFIGLNNRQKSSDYIDRMKDSWRELRNFDEDLYKDLIKYSYITSGFQMNSSQFFSYIPTEIFAEYNINDYIKSSARDFSNGKYHMNLIDNFFRSNINDNTIVPEVKYSKVEESIRNVGFLYVNDNIYNMKMYMKKTEINPYTGAQNLQMYRYSGRDEKGFDVYLRVSPINSRDSSGNRVYEYQKGRDVISSSENSVKVNPTSYRNLRSTIEDFNLNEQLGLYPHHPSTFEFNHAIDVKQSKPLYNTLEGEPVSGKITTYETDVGPIHYVTDRDGNLVMVKEQGESNINLSDVNENNINDNNIDPLLGDC